MTLTDKIKSIMDPTKIAGHKVGHIGFGLMNMTWRPESTPDNEAFATINKAVEMGANYIVTGEFYGSKDPEDGLKLLSRYYEKYPEMAEKIVLSIKGGSDLETLKPNGSPEGIRRSIDNVLKYVDGKAKLNVYCISRVDKETPLEVTYKIVKEEYLDTGKIGSVCISEVAADTIRKIVSICPVSCVEVEVSPWSTEIFDNGVADVCRELSIPIVAYSPLGRGFLTGKLKSPDDIPEGDMRRHMPRFSAENFPKNLEIVDALNKIASKKGVTPSQLAIAWVRQQGTNGLTIVPIFGATKEEQVVENLQDVSLSSDELAEIDNILKSMKPAGGRYPAFMEQHLYS